MNTLSNLSALLGGQPYLLAALALTLAALAAEAGSVALRYRRVRADDARPRARGDRP
jgi:hypothetical protein